MNTLIIAEHNNEQLANVTQSVLAAALQLNSKPDILIVGYQCQQAALAAASLSGVGKVLIADNQAYSNPGAEVLSRLILTIAGNYQTIIVAATTFGKNLLPRVAALLDVTQVSEVSQIISSDTFVHFTHAGNAVETVKVFDYHKIITIRPICFTAVNAVQPACVIEPLDTVIIDERITFIKQELTTTARPSLSNAKIIVAGGRGLQNAANFKLIEQLADVLGAAVGTTRAVVDAGFLPNEYQIGQTGKVVAPDLYVAVGISGAVQHLAGMKESKVIVAINKDADAPIFQFADYGIVGDLFEIVPQLIAQLNRDEGTI